MYMIYVYIQLYTHVISRSLPLPLSLSLSIFVSSDNSVCPLPITKYVQFLMARSEAASRKTLQATMSLGSLKLQVCGLVHLRST